LGRCPDRGWDHFQRYIGLGVAAYNLKKIVRKILEMKRKKLQKEKAGLKLAA
jgi:hypothetical protein